MTSPSVREHHKPAAALSVPETGAGRATHVPAGGPANRPGRHGRPPAGLLALQPSGRRRLAGARAGCQTAGAPGGRTVGAAGEGTLGWTVQGTEPHG